MFRREQPRHLVKCYRVVEIVTQGASTPRVVDVGFQRGYPSRHLDKDGNPNQGKYFDVLLSIYVRVSEKYTAWAFK